MRQLEPKRWIVSECDERKRSVLAGSGRLARELFVAEPKRRTMIPVIMNQAKRGST